MELVNCIDIWSVFLLLLFPELNFYSLKATCLCDLGLDCFEMPILTLKGFVFKGSQKKTCSLLICHPLDFSN